MKEIWELSIKTWTSEITDIETSFLAFDTFEKAKECLRSKLHDIAFSENKIFDQNGKIAFLEEYINELPEDDEACDEGYDDWTWTKKQLIEIEDALTGIFNGAEIDIDDITDYYDGTLSVSVNECYDFMRVHSCDAGVFPEIYTNMFDMSEEKDYFFYFDSSLCEDDTTKLFVDLNVYEYV